VIFKTTQAVASFSQVDENLMRLLSNRGQSELVAYQFKPTTLAAFLRVYKYTCT